MGESNPSTSVPAWDSHEESIEIGAQIPSAATNGPGCQDPISESGEPSWARPRLDCLLAERTQPTEKEVFERGWPSPLPSILPDIPDEVPEWAMGLLGDSERAHDVEVDAQDSDDCSLTADAWEKARIHFEQKTKLKALVTGFNKGGLLASLHRLQGFVPSSQLVCFPRHLDASARDAYLAQQKGSELDVMIIEMDPARNRLVLSERACVLDIAGGKALLETLTSGDVIYGLVSNLCDFGAFVDLGGIDGLIHVSEISWQRVGHPGDVLHVGDRVRVHVLSVDKEQGRIALSLKRLRRDPWESISERYSIGQVVEGVITNIVDFGAFVRIEAGLEGLVHVSEISTEERVDPQSVLTEGQQLELRILRIDGPNHRLALSIRQVQNPLADTA